MRHPDGQRHHLLLGRRDWGAATAGGVGLEGLWQLAPPLRPQGVPHWNGTDTPDDPAGTLCLPPILEELPASPADAPIDPARRRAAASDAGGNIYWIAADTTQIMVRSAGDGSTGRFWPGPRSRAGAPGLFRDVAAPAPSPAFTALAATDDGWLLAGTAAGLLAFDLIGGGPPMGISLPAPQPAISALAPRPGGGLWLLDGPGRRLHALDRRLAQATGAPPAAEPTLFQPEAGPPRAVPPAQAPGSHDLAALDAAIAPFAIAALPDGYVAILSRGPDRLYLWHASAPLPPPIALPFAPHDLVAAKVLRRGGETVLRVLVTGASGNQARAWAFAGGALQPTNEVYPLRRHGGLALASVGGHAVFDSGPAPDWPRIVEQPRQRHATEATLDTPLFDAGQPGAVWDRLRIDGCVPPGTRLAVEARCGDAADALGAWRPQPAPILSRSELVAHSRHAVLATDAAAGRGTLELLCQQMEGITLRGEGDATPQLRALRLSWPRMSWAQRWLPACYSETPADADFLTRWLANFEGTTSGIEARIASAAHLFDTATAPADFLPWLAGWFDVALDPAWNEARRRAFIAHAVQFFGWRGTIKGVESALALAFGAPLESTLFGAGDCTCPGTIRIVETYRTRLIGRVAAGDASFIDDAPEADVVAAERAAWVAFQVALGLPAAQRMAGLPRLVVPASHADHWAAFLARPNPPRALWQRHLAGRYRRIAALNAAHGTGWTSFAQVPLMDGPGATAVARSDWAQFSSLLLPIDRTAHRFSVLLPVAAGEATDSASLEQRRRLAMRIVALEKPAHTIFDVRFYFAMNRIGEARLGLDTTLGAGSRHPRPRPSGRSLHRARWPVGSRSAAPVMLATEMRHVLLR